MKAKGPVREEGLEGDVLNSWKAFSNKLTFK